MKLETRHFEIRSANTENREITGIGVPYDTEIKLWDGYYEQFVRGSVDSEGAILRYAHSEPIGTISAARDTDKGVEITARISETTRGNEVWQLVKDGVLTRMSIGFEPISKEETETDDGDIHVKWTSVKAREFSIVEFPAYETAEITNHRSKLEMKDNTPAPVDLTPLTERLDTLERSLATVREAAPVPAPTFASFGDFVAAYKRGDDAAKAFQRAAFTTASQGVGNLPAPWLGTLIDRMQAKQPVCEMFRRIPLPAKGMTLEYAYKKTPSTLQVAKQTAEGADLVTGQPSTWDIKSAKVETYGGVADNITRQVIERTTAPNVLDEIFTDLAFQYALAIEKAMQAELSGNLAAAEGKPTATLGKAVTAITVDDVLDTLLALSDAYEDTPFLMDGVIVSPSVFNALMHLKADDKALQLVGAPDKRLGSLSLAQPGKADVGNQWTIYRAKWLTGDHMAAYSKEAMTLAEDPGAPLRLEDENIHNLTKSFAVYGYAAIYTPRPDLIKAVKIGAAG